MNRTALAWAFMATFVLMATAIPFLDYRGGAFFTLLALFILSPFDLIAIALLLAFLYAAISAAGQLWQHDVSSVRSFAFAIVFLVCDALLIWYVVASLLSQSPPHWFTHGVIYGIISEALFRVFIAVLVVFLLGVPVCALIVALVQLARRQWFGLRYVAVVAVGFACYRVSFRANDLLTVASCSQGIQSTLVAMHDHRKLPATSQVIRFALVKGRPIVVCMLDGGPIDEQYIAYDQADSSPDSVSRRAGMLMDSNCNVWARKIRYGYYWTTSGGC